LQNAWEKSKDESGAVQMAIANRAVGKLLIARARLGQMNELKQLLSDIGKRPFFGSDDEMVRSAHQCLSQMENNPARSFRCGPAALFSLLQLHQPAKSTEIDKANSTKDGTNLTQMKELAHKVGLNYQIAKRSSGAALIVPSVMHWKVGHFAALVRKEGTTYIVKDPTFDTDGTLGTIGKTLEDESDGYFLVPSGPLPKGWIAVNEAEGKTVWGKGLGTNLDTNPPGPCTNPCGCPGAASGASGSGSGTGSGGMAQASARSLSASSRIFDSPER
jgi:hypothetical protein